MIIRAFEPLYPQLVPGKVLVLFGARQVGKTTLIKNMLSSLDCRWRLESGDNILVHEALSEQSFPKLLSFVEGLDLLAIDEAQRIPDIGRVLKIWTDQVPLLRIIVTGSSSFELAGQIGEPLTGRKRTFIMYPVSMLELTKDTSAYELSTRLDEFLVYGSYPAVLTASTSAEKREILEDLVGSYLLKDVLELERVRASRTLLDLLRLLAYQIGSEVSAHELALKLSIDGKTVARYLDLLEKSFVLFSLGGYSGNLRKEITRKNKYYFLDLGIRNALLANFNPPDRRDDKGALWENFLMVERMKTRAYRSIYANPYFWRTWDQKEIDLIEERDGVLHTFEFKWKPQSGTAPRDFTEAYPGSPFTVVHRENWQEFLLPKP
jgi:predicted AAA+ superfamily ATPase